MSKWRPADPCRKNPDAAIDILTSFTELLLAIGRTNALSLFKVKGEAQGYALCPVFSLLNHSCLANCRYDMAKNNTHVTVR